MTTSSHKVEKEVEHKTIRTAEEIFSDGEYKLKLGFGDGVVKTITVTIADYLLAVGGPNGVTVTPRFKSTIT
ncbi:MAG: hypothetical protein A2854_04580 [Parcubacteria group bacterium RIFCSPHIGHO2_01_FULL_56_18]|nr:MAG: hypothetical protein A2854_04580 [Parcubacteria group bacterium RIFCSPHIGHO2_01_FULL_56_18]